MQLVHHGMFLVCLCASCVLSVLDEGGYIAVPHSGCVEKLRPAPGLDTGFLTGILASPRRGGLPSG